MGHKELNTYNFLYLHVKTLNQFFYMYKKLSWLGGSNEVEKTFNPLKTE